MKKYLPELEPNGVPAVDGRVVTDHWGYERSELKTQIEISRFILGLVGLPTLALGVVATPLALIPGTPQRKEFQRLRQGLNRPEIITFYKDQAEENIGKILTIFKDDERLAQGGIVTTMIDDINLRNKDGSPAVEVNELRMTRLPTSTGADVTEWDFTTTNRWENTGNLKTRLLFFTRDSGGTTPEIFDAYVHNRKTAQVHPLQEYDAIKYGESRASVYEHIGYTLGHMYYTLRHGHEQRTVEVTAAD